MSCAICGQTHPSSLVVATYADLRMAMAQECLRIQTRWAGETWWREEAAREGYCSFPTPWDINNGACEEFAYAVHARIPQAEPLWGSDAGYGDPLGDHMFLKWHGRYYDAQEEAGVDEFRQLPFYRSVPRSG